VPRVSRRRAIAAAPAEVWSLISDPYSLPRWYPRAVRVENVSGPKGGRRGQWTTVLETADRRGVRADFRCISSAENERYVWEQDLEGSPFGKILRSSVLEIGIEPADGRTEVRLTSIQKLRGMSRFGSPMMRRATGRNLDEALDGIEMALVEMPQETDA
jgi:uncharacterized protein YndB with AHSA1/START domain